MLRAPCRFAPAPGVLLGPGPLVAALPVHRLHNAGLDDSSGARAELAQLTADTSWRPKVRLGAIFLIAARSWPGHVKTPGSDASEGTAGH